MAILVTQGYLVVVGILVAYSFTMLPEWTTWALLVAMALYDLAAVLLPIGPLRILVELAISRDEEIPALVYEARPVNHGSLDPMEVTQRRLWRERRVQNLNANSVLAHGPDNVESHADSGASAGYNRDGADLVRENASLNSILNADSSRWDCCTCLCLAGLLLFSCSICYCIVMLYDSFINLSFLFCFPVFF